MERNEVSVLSVLSNPFDYLWHDSYYVTWKYKHNDRWLSYEIVTGLEIAEALQQQEKKLLLVFVTGHDELVYDSLKFHPFGFVRKSFLDTELHQVLEDCAKEVSRGKVYGKDKEYRFRDTLTNVQNVLEKDGFVRVHRGFLVNQAAVEILGTEEVHSVL